MKIAFVTPEFVTENSFDGGLANYLDKISLVLLEKNHSVFIFVASNKDEIFSHKNRTIIRVNVTSRVMNITKIELLKKFSRSISWIVQSYKLNQAIKKIHNFINFEIVQYSSYTATAIFAPKNINSIARISSFQPLWNQYYEWKLDEKVLKTEEFLELFALKRVKKVFGPSQVIANEINLKFKKKITIIESPLITLKKEEFDYSIFNKEFKDKQYLLFFGSLGLLKGVKEIADIVYQVLEKYQDLHFIFIGKDANYNKKPIFSYVKEKAKYHENRCIHIESLNREKLFPIIENAYAVILPSRIDNFPNTCTEAMSLKKIVVGTRGTSFEQLIENKINGFLCTPSNSNSLFNSINEVINLPIKEKKQIEENAFNTIKRLTPDKIVLKHEKIYTFLSYPHVKEAYKTLISKVENEPNYDKITLFGFNILAEIFYDEFSEKISLIFDNKIIDKQFCNHKILKFDSSYNFNDSIIIITAINKKAIQEIIAQIRHLYKEVKIIHL